jgi:thiol-disulfide isomerase/thioredoxin
MLATLFALSLSANAVAVPSEAPALKDDTGAVHAVPAADGEITFLYFWAVWCYPCEPVGRQLVRLHESYVERGLRVLAIAYTDSEDPSAWARAQGYRFPIVVEGGHEFARSRGVDRIPTVIILDREGSEITRYIGYREEFEARLRELLDERLAPAQERAAP